MTVDLGTVNMEMLLVGLGLCSIPVRDADMKPISLNDDAADIGDFAIA